MDFIRCKRGYPCPICDHANWCTVSSDGRICNCRRVGSGGEERRDKSGGIYYVHRLDGTKPRPKSEPLPTRIQATKAGPELLHTAYATMLSAMVLSEQHRKNLRRRKLSDAEIVSRGYRTLTEEFDTRTRIAQALRERFGDAILGVPGIAAMQEQSALAVVEAQKTAGSTTAEPELPL